MAMIVVKLFTPKVGAEQELLFYEPAFDIDYNFQTFWS
jgi:hypothetical protein